jgi:hypothetical protein
MYGPVVASTCPGGLSAVQACVVCRLLPPASLMGLLMRSRCGGHYGSTLHTVHWGLCWGMGVDLARPGGFTASKCVGVTLRHRRRFGSAGSLSRKKTAENTPCMVRTYLPYCTPCPTDEANRHTRVAALLGHTRHTVTNGVSGVSVCHIHIFSPFFFEKK